jgi:hypothetical protein
MLLMLQVFSLLFFFGTGQWWKLYGSEVVESVQHRLSLVQDRRYYVQQLVTESVKWDTLNDSFTLDTEALKHLENQLREVNTALYNGNQKMRISLDVRYLSGGEDVLNKGSCDILMEQSLLYDNVSSCEDVLSGVLRQSGPSVILSFIDQSQALRQEFRTWQESNSSSNSSELQGIYVARVRTFNELGGYWIPKILSYYDSWLHAAYDTVVEHIISVRLYSTIAFILVLFILGVCCYYPMINRMREELQATRNLLSIIPSDLLDTKEQGISASLLSGVKISIIDSSILSNNNTFSSTVSSPMLLEQS